MKHPVFHMGITSAAAVVCASKKWLRSILADEIIICIAPDIQTKRVWKQTIYYIKSSFYTWKYWEGIYPIHSTSTTGSLHEN